MTQDKKSYMSGLSQWVILLVVCFISLTALACNSSKTSGNKTDPGQLLQKIGRAHV